MLDLGFFREALALLPCPRIQMDMLCRMTSWLCWLVHVRIIVGGQWLPMYLSRSYSYEYITDLWAISRYSCKEWWCRDIQQEAEGQNSGEAAWGSVIGSWSA